jgi:hypothetical protein
MKYSDSTNKTGLVELIRRLTNTDANSYPIADLTADFNSIYDEYVSLALSADDTWQWDDAAQTKLPIATTNIVSGQRDYQFDAEILKVLKVLVADSNGDFREIEQIDPQEKNVYSQDMTTQSVLGTPVKYDLLGDSIRLYPRPDYNYAKGLKVYYQRKQTEMLASDTTKVPGIPSLFHSGLAFGTAHLFALVKNQPTVDRLGIKDKEQRKAMVDFLAKRNKAQNLRIRVAKPTPAY